MCSSSSYETAPLHRGKIKIRNNVLFLNLTTNEQTFAASPSTRQGTRRGTQPNAADTEKKETKRKTQQQYTQQHMHTHMHTQRDRVIKDKEKS